MNMIKYEHNMNTFDQYEHNMNTIWINEYTKKVYRLGDIEKFCIAIFLILEIAVAVLNNSK